MAVPWFRHAGWVSREPADFSVLRTMLSDVCRREDADAGGRCAGYGGAMAQELAIVTDGSPGALLRDAQALAVELLAGDLAHATVTAAAMEVVDCCFADGTYGAACLLEQLRNGYAVTDAFGEAIEARALWLLGKLPDGSSAAAAAALAGVSRTTETGAYSEGPLALALRTLDPPCGDEAEACDRVRYDTFLLDEWSRLPVVVGGAAQTGWGAGARAGAGPATAAGPGPSPAMTLGEPVSFGGLTKEVVRRVVGQHRARIRQCYESALRALPKLAGLVTVKFVVAPDGSVTSAEPTANDTGDAELGLCVAGVVKSMSFPPADGITSCNYPFVFQMVGE